MEEKVWLNVQMQDTQITIVQQSDKRYLVTLSRAGRVTCEDCYLDHVEALKRVCVHINFLGPFMCLLNCTAC